MMKSLVSPQWLFDNLNDPNLIILDASTKTNVSGVQAEQEGIFIQGARKIDKQNFIDRSIPFPNAILDPKSFEIEARKLGIDKQSKIVVYDNLGIYTSPRIWWMFNLMGHNLISVLDGGLPAWQQNGYPCDKHLNIGSGIGNFEVNYCASFFRNTEDIRCNLDVEKEKVIDARSSDRFYGKAPEPRPNLKSGHIPNSINIHFSSVLENGKMKQKEELELIFEKFKEESLVFTCGSGTTACILMLAADQVLDGPLAIYDGSWSEWGSREDCPFEV